MKAGPEVQPSAAPEANSALKASLRAAAIPVQASSAAALGATAALLALIVLSVAWEWWLAPLRPGGSLLALKGVALLFALPGVWRRRLYTLQWASMLILLYFTEGVVRGWSEHGLSAHLAWLQTALAVVFFVCALVYVGPFKRAAKQAARLKAAQPDPQAASPALGQFAESAESAKSAEHAGSATRSSGTDSAARVAPRATSHPAMSETHHPATNADGQINPDGG